MDQYDKAMFEQEFSKRNQDARDVTETSYVERVCGLLQAAPFCYPAPLANSVASGVVRHGDQLVTNVQVENQDDDHDEVNYMGDQFNSFTDFTTLELTVTADTALAEQQRCVFRGLYPQPAKHYLRSEHSETHCHKALEHVKWYLRSRAFLGFSAGIVLYGKMNEDGLQFGSGEQTVPLEMLEQAVGEMLTGLLTTEPDKELPRFVDLMVVDSGGLRVSLMDRDRGAEGIRRLRLLGPNHAQ